MLGVTSTQHLEQSSGETGGLNVMNDFGHVNLEQILQHQLEIRLSIEREVYTPTWKGFRLLAWLLASIAHKLDPQIRFLREVKP